MSEEGINKHKSKGIKNDEVPSGTICNANSGMITTNNGISS
jgi:hypothetical protein